jgi:hypothetical protein
VPPTERTAPILPPRPDGLPLSAALPGSPWEIPAADEADYGPWIVLAARHGFEAGDQVRLERFGRTLFVASDTWSIDIPVDRVTALAAPDALWLAAGTRRLVLAPAGGQDVAHLASRPW